MIAIYLKRRGGILWLRFFNLKKQCTCEGASFVELKNSLMEVAFHIHTTKILQILHIVEWWSPFGGELGDTFDMMRKDKAIP